MEKTQAVVDFSISHRVKKCRLAHTWYNCRLTTPVADYFFISCDILYEVLI